MRDNRQTPQRRLIALVLREAGRPLTAGEIYARAAERRPRLAKSTVYRNLDIMRERGDVVHGRLADGESYYEAAGSGHRHYMICLSCQRMLDLPECPLGDLERRVAETEGFAVTDHVVQLYGYCRDCRRQREAEAGETDGHD